MAQELKARVSPLAVGLAVGLALATATLLAPLPAAAAPALRHGLPLPLLTGLVFFVALRGHPSRAAEVTGTAISLTLFALPLVGLWATGASEDGVIGGLLPWYDASVYHADAHRLLAGESLSASVSRPWSVGLTAILLGTTALDLQTTVALLWALPAVASVLFARVVGAVHGAAAGGLALALLFYFGRPSSGTLLTEGLGLALGALGFASVAASTSTSAPEGPAETRDTTRRATVLGLAAAAAGLAARPGALLVMPLLAIALAGRGPGSARRLAVALAACLAPFLLASALARLIGSPHVGLVDLHFAYSFHGLVTGGTGWQSALVADPGLRALGGAELSDRVLGLAIAHAAAHPSDVALGAWRSWLDFFSLRGRGAFGFVGGDGTPPPVLAVLRGALWVLALRGARRAARDGGPGRWVLWASAGIVLSVPFVPPRDAATRPYAATLPVLAWLVALGLPRVALTSRVGAPTPRDGLRRPAAPALAGVVLLALIFAGSLLVRGRTTAHGARVACPEGRSAVRVHLAPGSAVRLSAAGAAATRGPLAVPVDRFRAGLRGFDPPDVATVLASVDAGTALANPYLVGEGQAALLLLPDGAVPRSAQGTDLCVERSLTSGGWLVLRAGERASDGGGAP